MEELLVQTAFWGGALTLGCYILGVWLRNKLRNPIANPMLFAVAIIIFLLVVWDVDYASYSVSTQAISYLVTPATVCFAIPLYRQLHQLRKNYPAILCGIGAGALTHLVTLFGASILFHMDARQQATMVAKSVTNAIATGITAEQGGIVTITIGAVMVTGIFGNIIADVLFKVCRIQNPVAQGVALGSSAHIMGTARAMELGDVQGAMSSLAVVVSGLITVVTAPIYMGWVR